jgi:hypothetical protein
MVLALHKNISNLDRTTPLIIKSSLFAKRILVKNYYFNAKPVIKNKELNP